MVSSITSISKSASIMIQVLISLCLLQGRTTKAFSPIKHQHQHQHQHPLWHPNHDGTAAFSSQSSSSSSSSSQLFLAKSELAKKRLVESWLPLVRDGLDKDAIDEIENKSLELAANLISRKLKQSPEEEITLLQNSTAAKLARGRFLDLCMTKEGEQALEQLFQDEIASEEDQLTQLGAIFCIQSLCVMGSQVDAKGAPHLSIRYLMKDEWKENKLDITTWSRESATRIKLELLQGAATQLLSTLKWKRTHQGAFNLLVQLGGWTQHENTALLRSGFPIRFTEKQESDALTVVKQLEQHDPDELLNIRQDFRQTHKIYTIDSASTTEIDDGLSIEVIENEDGTTRQKLWIHIADVERWANPSGEIWKMAKTRATTHYLPTGPIPMLPGCLSSGIMSLTPNTSKNALSLGVELNSDGSINGDSLEVTASKINVAYRLTYDEVDDMLEEGVGYSEEWQLGALLEAATIRRNYRISQGSTEGEITNPIPQGVISTYEDKSAPDGIGIKIVVETSHNAGMNQTDSSGSGNAPTVSSANLLVTEMMILGGEALGKWKEKCDAKPPSFCGHVENKLKLGFRTQMKPDFRSCPGEYKVLQDLKSYNQGDGYCHAWFFRRFFNPVKISDMPLEHFGLGLECYVQWSSPIRRFGDLQAHTAVKRFLRRKRLYDLVYEGLPVPSGITASDLGCPLPDDQDISDQILLDSDLDFRSGQAVISSSRKIQKTSYYYWLFEHLNRLIDESSSDEDKKPVVFEAIVLGCVNPKKKQYAVYLPELGFEHKYTSEFGYIELGRKLKLTPSQILPRFCLMTLCLAK